MANRVFEVNIDFTSVNTTTDGAMDPEKFTSSVFNDFPSTDEAALDRARSNMRWRDIQLEFGRTMQVVDITNITVTRANSDGDTIPTVINFDLVLEEGSRIYTINDEDDPSGQDFIGEESVGATHATDSESEATNTAESAIQRCVTRILERANTYIFERHDPGTAAGGGTALPIRTAEITYSAVSNTYANALAAVTVTERV